MANHLPSLPEIEKLSHLVIRILGGNPSKFTLQGTNTYLIGTGASRILVDTGQGEPSWFSLLSSVLSSESAIVSHALISHWHPDHVGGIKDLLTLCPNAIIYKNEPTAGQLTINDRQIFKTKGATVRAFHCPGHTTDHMAFILQEEDAMFTGDNVLGHGTAVFENLVVYLDSLGRMREQCKGRAYPGHGAVIGDARAKIEEYVAHRQQREAEILQALRDVDKEATPMELVKVVYKDVPENLHEPAAHGAVQILRKLSGEAKVTQTRGEKWMIAKKVAP